MKSTVSTKKVVITALLAALTVVGSAIRVTIPIDIGGNTSFHLGNILCALAGLLLGPWYGGLAAAIGSAIYDCFNPIYISESWITFLSKGAYGVVAGLVARCGIKLLRKEFLTSTIATIAGALTYAMLYLLKAYIKGIYVQELTHEAAMISVAGKLPATIFNGVVAIIFAPIGYIAIKKALVKNHLSILD